MSTRTATDPVFSEDRVRRLRILLGVLAATGLLATVLALHLLTSGTDQSETRPFALSLAATALLLLLAAGGTWVVLPRRTPAVRRASTACGVLAVLAAFPAAAVVFGFVWAILGLFVIVLSLGSDEP